MIELANVVLNWALLVACVVVFGCYLRRVGLLNIAAHKTGSVVFHVMLGSLTFGVGLHAWYGQVGLYELSAFGAAATWIVVSFKDWRDGVPERAFRPGPTSAQAAFDQTSELMHDRHK